MILERKRLSGDVQLTVSISLHCLARFFQRQASGNPGGIDELTAALCVLAEAAPSLISERRSTVCVETAGGSWRGYLATDDQKRWADVRTFF